MLKTKKKPKERKVLHPKQQKDIKLTVYYHSRTTTTMKRKIKIQKKIKLKGKNVFSVAEHNAADTYWYEVYSL